MRCYDRTRFDCGIDSVIDRPNTPRDRPVSDADGVIERVV